GFERPVVVKRILPHLVRQQSFVDMFLDEAKTIATIRHPNVVNIHDFRHEDGELFMVMEYLEGETTASLRRRLNKRGELMPVGLWCHIFSETCAGLHAAHQATNESGMRLNLVHRDVSPPNILVTYDGAVKLIDFGIAKSDYRSSQTDAGHIKGKYAYMSPEQARGKPLDARSDIFSLGVVMFEMTTGRRLFKRETELQTVQAVCNDPIPDPKIVVPDYPDELFRICCKALARAPSERYQSALELRRDLLAFMHADKTAPLPEELIAIFMQDMFEDRIEMKRGLLQRVRRGERFETFTSATDSIIEVSALLPGTLPSSPQKTNAPISMLQDGEFTVTPLPQRIWRSWSFLPLIVLLSVVGIVALLVSSGAEKPAKSAAKQDQVFLEFASEPSGASVEVGDRFVGKTPLKVKMPVSSRPIAVTLRHEGYAPWTTVLKPTRDVLVKGHLTAIREDSESTTP
ncbi:MAG: serine/threonine-protein kinase, partial [Myxococcota bacterium]